MRFILAISLMLFASGASAQAWTDSFLREESPVTNVYSLVYEFTDATHSAGFDTSRCAVLSRAFDASTGDASADARISYESCYSGDPGSDFSNCVPIAFAGNEEDPSNQTISSPRQFTRIRVLTPPGGGDTARVTLACEAPGYEWSGSEWLADLGGGTGSNIAQETVAGSLSDLEACFEGEWKQEDVRVRTCRLSCPGGQGINITTQQDWRLSETVSAVEPDEFGSRTMVLDFGHCPLQVAPGSIGDDTFIMRLASSPRNNTQAAGPEPFDEADLGLRVYVRGLTLYGDPTASNEVGLFITENRANISTSRSAWIVEDSVIGKHYDEASHGFGQDKDTPLVFHSTSNADLYMARSTFNGRGGNNDRDTPGDNDDLDEWPREQPCGGAIVCLGIESATGSGNEWVHLDGVQVNGTDASTGNPCLAAGASTSMGPLFTRNCSGVLWYGRGTAARAASAQTGDLHLAYESNVVTPQTAITFGAGGGLDMFKSVVDVSIFPLSGDVPLTIFEYVDSLDGGTAKFSPRSIRATVFANDLSGPLFAADADALPIQTEAVDITLLPGGGSSQPARFDLANLADDDFLTRVAAHGAMVGTVRTPLGNWTFSDGVPLPGLDSGKVRSRIDRTDLALLGTPEPTFARNVKTDLLNLECESEDGAVVVEASVGGVAISPTVRCESDYGLSDVVFDCDSGECATGGLRVGDVFGPAEALAGNSGRIVCDGGTPSTHFEVEPVNIAQCDVGTAVNVETGSFQCFFSTATNPPSVQVTFTSEPTGQIGCEYRGAVDTIVDLSADANAQGILPGVPVDIRCTEGCDGAGGDVTSFWGETRGAQ